jgi:hypothetical protein
MILNEYFKYFEQKHQSKEKTRADKLFSFRSAEPIDSALLFG